MMRHFAHSITVAVACMLLVSCASITEQPEKQAPAPSEPAGWSAEKRTRQQIENWEIRGRLGVQTEHTGGTMDIIWKQSGDDFTIRLMAPLGAGNYLIRGEKGFAEIRFPDGEKKIIDNIDDIFASALEVELPASVVRDWVRGLPASALPVDQIVWNKQGLINRVKQAGWNVEMTRYTGAKTVLPHSIFVSRDDNAELDVRLILRQWLIDN